MDTNHPSECEWALEALGEFQEAEIDTLLKRLADAIASTRMPIDDLGMDVSIYPGEDDGVIAPPRDIVNYVLDHVWRFTTDAELSRAHGPCEGMLELVKETEPGEFIALLTLYADTIGDSEGVQRGAFLLETGCVPYREQLQAYKRRVAGGKSRGANQSVENAERNAKIQATANALLRDGKPGHEITHILAKRFKLSPRQIRRIALKKTDVS